MIQEMMDDRKAQVWYTDFMVGVLIFVVVMSSYFYYVEHTQHSDDNLMTTLLSEGKTISSTLVAQGYPAGWTTVNVTNVGLTDGGARMNLTKLSNFNSWSYEERRGYIHTTKDYYFYLEYMNNTRFNELCIDPGANCSDWNSSYNLVQSTRLLVYGSDIVRMVLYVYQATG
ncbi:MAG: hypothetical protein V1729_02180 [Candidatus Woesearchaeota archaeon]